MRLCFISCRAVTVLLASLFIPSPLSTVPLTSSFFISFISSTKTTHLPLRFPPRTSLLPFLTHTCIPPHVIPYTSWTLARYALFCSASLKGSTRLCFNKCPWQTQLRGLSKNRPGPVFFPILVHFFFFLHKFALTWQVQELSFLIRLRRVRGERPRRESVNLNSVCVCVCVCVCECACECMMKVSYWTISIHSGKTLILSQASSKLTLFRGVGKKLMKWN